MLRVDLDAFGLAANWSRLPEKVAAFQIHDTATDMTFPGALLPAVAANGRVFWYAAVRNPAEWRELSPLLVAYAGPTLTNFRGLALQPNPDKPPERILQAAAVCAMARLIPTAREEDVYAVARSLQRLRTALRQRPATRGRPLEAVSTILGRLDLCLAMGDRPGAEAALLLLSEYWQLDTINLHFLSCRVFGAFRDWAGLLRQPWFEDLCAVPKPAPIALTLLRALWNVHLEPLARDRAKLRTEYFRVCRALVLSLLPDLQTSEDPVVVAIRELEGIPALAHAAVPIAMPALPDSWATWLARIDEAEFTDAVSAARSGAETWGVWIDPAQLGGFAESFLRDPATTVGQLRLREALPSLILWIKRDPEFPRRAAEMLYQAVFARLILLDGRGTPEREAISDLYETLLSLGVSVRDYQQLSSDIAQLASEAPGKTTIDWLLDLSAITLRHAAPDAEARLRALNAILTALQSARPLLSSVHRAAYSVLAVMAGWEDLPPENVGPEEAAVFAALSGKSIAIYTLTEGAARQATDVLKKLVPDLKVETVHDHVCTPRLENLSRTSDLMVVAWSSAKHAATDCIQRHRRGKPTAYAAGRGISSLVRAVTEFDW